MLVPALFVGASAGRSINRSTGDQDGGNMGISGLLPVLKSITETKTIDQYKGQTLAIDGYCWLHRAIYCCSQEICLGEDTDKYVIYFIDRIHALLQNGITPYVVFDGGPLPMKKDTEEERRKSRAKNKELGLQQLRQKNYSEARKYFVRAADVSPYMAHRVIQRLKGLNVQYVVAPYEADAQLAFLMKNGLVDGVITEDSDCIPFGCSKVLFKMDRDGIAQEVRTENLKHNTGLSFHMFSDEMFLEMCIFSGCDYLASLPGFALKKAYALMKQHGSYTKILRALRMEGKVRIPSTYEAEFERAVLTFRHQRVFDPVSQTLVTLTPLSNEQVEQDATMDFLGPIIPHEEAQAIARGDMDPISRVMFATSHPAAVESSQSSLQRSRVMITPRVDHNPRVVTKPQAPPARSLPAWMSRKASQFAASAPTTSSAPPPSRSPPKAHTPKTISHFFAAKSANSSSPDEKSKPSDCPLPTLSREQSTESTYQSQDPQVVDVAKGISCSPAVDEEKHLHPSGKENASPNSVKPSPEDAFSRMMRAGTSLQKYSLKRKLSTSGRLSAGIVKRHATDSSLDRIKSFGFSSCASEVSSQSTETLTSQLEAASEAPVQPDVEPESANVNEESSSQSCTIEDESFVPDDVPSVTVARRTPVDAFARFRFGSKHT